MTWWHRLWRRSRMEDQLEKELRFHLDQHAADLIAQGRRPDEARREARLALGGPEQVKEQCRDARGTRWLEDLLHDLRYSTRRLRSSPGFAAVTVITLAVGIGASAAIFSAVNPILFEPLPYPQADRITMIRSIGANRRPSDSAFGTFRELAQRSRSFEAITVMKSWQPAITGEGRPERLDGQSVNAPYFRVLGVSPVVGRDFEPADDQINGSKVVILADALWRRRFGGDTGIVGRPVTLDNDSYTVIGVMPAGFENVMAPSAEVWTPLQYDISQGRAWGQHLRMVGRLRAGVGTDQARREVDAIASAPMLEFPRAAWASLDQGFIVNSLQDEVTRAVRPALLAALGAVLLVLVIACVNVTNLLLGRAAGRRGEFAMRAALGAGGTRLIRQLLTESLLLASLGGVLGILLAELGVRALRALSPPGLPRLDAIGLDGAVFGFALGITTLVGLVVGLIPAFQASRTDLHTGMQQDSRRTVGGQRLTRHTLVVAEVALALVLLVSAGLLLRSMQQLFAIAPGFNAGNLLTMQVQTVGHRFDDENTTNRFFAGALEAVRRVPGVTAAAFTSQLPLSGDLDVYGARFEGDDPDKGQEVFRYAVSPGYLETMSIPLVRGRLLDQHDTAGAPSAVVISESLARRQFAEGDPVGKRVHIGRTDVPWMTVVGVVGNVRQASLAASQTDAVYITPEQWYSADNALSLVVRARGDAAALAPAIRNAVWSVDKDQPIVRVATMKDLLAATAAERRFTLILFETFGIVALVLAATGIYGVLSGSVTERTREMGVRSALGATRANILALVLRQGMTLTALGVAIGLAGAVAASHALVTMLFGISGLDSVTYISVIALLIGVSVIACWVPAWRAARVDPATTLRSE